MFDGFRIASLMSIRNRDCAGDGGRFVIGDAVQLTLREMRRQLMTPRLNGVLAIIGLVLAILGPFRTAESMLPIPRVLYWLAVSFATYYAAAIAGVFVLRLLEKKVASRLVRIGLASAAQALAVSVASLVILTSALGADMAFASPVLSRAVASTLAVSFLVSAAFLVLGRMDERLDTDATPTPPDMADGPRLLTRLDFGKRGALVSISVEDHYVNVTTVRGRSMILLRLADAIAETNPVEGLQIHRSHWVAIPGIAEIEREGKKVIIVTTAGERLPVSRTYLPALREHGLLR